MSISCRAPQDQAATNKEPSPQEMKTHDVKLHKQHVLTSRKNVSRHYEKSVSRHYGKSMSRCKSMSRHYEKSMSRHFMKSVLRHYMKSASRQWKREVASIAIDRDKGKTRSQNPKSTCPQMLTMFNIKNDVSSCITIKLCLWVVNLLR